MARHLVMILVDDTDKYFFTKELLEYHAKKFTGGAPVPSTYRVEVIPDGINQGNLIEYTDHVNDIRGEYEVLLDELDGK